MILSISEKPVIIDKDDFEKIKKHRWSVISSGEGKFRAYSTDRKLMHRLIMDAPKGIEVDHINGNTLDNRKSNLRLCTHAQNQRNRKMNKNNKTGYKGVSWIRRDKKYLSSIRYKNTTINIGKFDDKKEAGYVYDQVAEQLFGDFNNHNDLV